MTESTIPQIRAFNRTVAERIGALDDRFLHGTRPMNEARLLWEVGAEGRDLRDLRIRLGLDSGYLTRVLASLETQGLLKVQASTSDGRVRRASLTKAGLRERASLDRNSDRLAAEILEPLTEEQRNLLVSSMVTVERLLTASMITLETADPASADAQWCFAQYFDELARRFDAGFDPGLSISADPHEIRSPNGVVVLARLRGRPVGCAALKLHAKAPGEIKRMWTAPALRGMGLGKRLLRDLEARARAARVRVLHLETNKALTEAITLYRGAGYTEVKAFNKDPYAHHWFEKRLTSVSSPA
jgi:DNA-binding MarR family transcriptional regulator